MINLYRIHRIVEIVLFIGLWTYCDIQQAELRQWHAYDQELETKGVSRIPDNLRLHRVDYAYSRMNVK